MKQLLTLLLFMPLLASAQEEINSRLRISLTGGYADHASSSGTVYMNSSTTATSDWNIGLSAGIALNEKWEVGLGVGYQKQIASTKMGFSMPLKNSITDGSLEVIFVGSEVDKVETSQWIVHAYATHYQHLFNRLYFTPTATFGFGNANTDIKAMARTVLFGNNTTLIDNTSVSGGNNFTQQNFSFDVFVAQLSPGLTYFFGKHIAATLNLGGVQCSLTDWEWSSRQWLASLSPVYWQYGIAIAF